jgi:hypothetical protein
VLRSLQASVAAVAAHDKPQEAASGDGVPSEADNHELIRQMTSFDQTPMAAVVNVLNGLRESLPSGSFCLLVTTMWRVVRLYASSSHRASLRRLP